MAKQKSKSPRKKKAALDPLSFMHQPHDKYARFVLQTKEVALELLQFCLNPPVYAKIDLQSLELSNESFIDARLRAHFSDICYTGLTRDEKPVRITLFFEHKSDKPEHPVMEQLIRYVSNIWHNDIRQGRRLSLTIPVLIYHGPVPLTKETPEVLFPDAPKELLEFIPAFNYVLLDIGSISDDKLENLHFLLLRNILLALKHSRDAAYIELYWKKIIIFAPEVTSRSLSLEIFQATAIYMSRTSNIFNEKIKDMDTALSTAEEMAVKPYLIQLYEDGMEKGYEKGVEKGMEKLLKAFIKKNPTWTDQQIAASFDITPEWVKQIRLILS